MDLSAIPKIPKGDGSNWWAVHGKYTSTGRGNDGRCIPSPSKGDLGRVSCFKFKYQSLHS